MTRRLLEKQGYRVLEATSGREALHLWDGGAQADLLLTDVIMPDGINGRKLAEELRTKKPDLKVLYVSGFSGEVLGRDTGSIRRESGFFLQKPFSPADLFRTVRQSLDMVRA